MSTNEEAFGGVAVKFEIDETKISIITRAQRLKPVAIKWLNDLRDTLVAHSATHHSSELAELDEVLAWLNDMEV